MSMTRNDCEQLAEWETNEDIEIGDDRFQNLLNEAGKSFVMENKAFAADATFALTLTSGTSEYDKPTNMISNQFVEMRVDTSGRYANSNANDWVRYVPVDFKDRNAGGPCYWFQGTKMFVDPAPTDDMAATVWYKSLPVEMTQASTDNGVNNNSAQKAITYLAIKKYYVADDDELAQKFSKEYVNELYAAYESVSDLEPGEMRRVISPMEFTEE